MRNDLTYDDAQRLFSPARMQKYLKACNGNKENAMLLYGYNIRLSQAFFGVVSMFEIIFRNAINNHYLATLGEDWITKQAIPNGLLEHETEEVTLARDSYKKEKIYSHDKMVGSFTFGFWTYLFTKRNYKIGGKTLLQIFPLREKGTTQKLVYSEITSIREFRNRIAHHEPICFDTHGAISTNYIKFHYDLIKKYLVFMATDIDATRTMMISPEEWITKVEKLREEYKKA